MPGLATRKLNKASLLFITDFYTSPEEELGDTWKLVSEVIERNTREKNEVSIKKKKSRAVCLILFFFAQQQHENAKEGIQSCSITKKIVSSCS